MKAREILETCLYVDDLSAAERFYRDVLGLEFVSRQDHRHVFFRCGKRMLLIFQPDSSAAEDSELPVHGARGPGHVAFAAADDELAAWQDRLQKQGIQIEKTIDWPQGGRSLYFRDPAGNSLEFASPRIWGLEDADVFAKSFSQ